MEFLLIDLAATLVFVLGYLTVVTLRQARTLRVAAAPAAARVDRPGKRERPEWPRLSYPR